MHVRKLPSGRYRWIVQHAGQRRDGTEATRGEAVLAGSRALISLGSDKSRSVGLTVRDMLDAWQAERLAEWSPTYAADIETVTDKLPATFTGRDIGTVTPPVIAALHRELAAADWSNHRIGRVHAAISQAFVLGVKHGWVNTNPARDLKAPKVKATSIEAPDHDTVKAILDAAPKRLHLVLRLAALTGARLGELVALQWIDVDRDVLTVRRAAIYTPASGLVVRDTTKSGRKGDRRLELDDKTIAMLADHRAEQTAKAAADRLPAPVYIFSHDAGVTPWRPGYVGLAYRRVRDGVERAGHIRFHDLRHHVATEMLNDGEHPIKVAAQLGHSSTTTTLRVYAHYLPGQGGESVRKRASRLDD